MLRSSFTATTTSVGPRLLRWCERRNVSYIVGIAKNSRLEKLALNRRYEAAICAARVMCAHKVTTLRVRLLKFGTVVTRNIRRFRTMMSSHYPDQVLYAKVMRKLLSG